MVTLPTHHILPIEHLTASFNKVTNSYKFYWFLAILEHIRENQSPIISIDNLLAKMIANVWYPTNFFRLSFGKQDRLGQLASHVGELGGLPMDARHEKIIQFVEQILTNHALLADEIRSLGNYVPYRFLRPFFTQQLTGIDDWKVNQSVESLAAQAFFDQKPCMYRFSTQPTGSIEIQPNWFDYLIRHLNILTDFCLWNLVNYLQKNNPNIPNIPGKLVEPEHRDLKQARTFWKVVFDSKGSLPCIYSGQTMQKYSFSLDHFLPWRFVAHDLLWNIIPTPKNVNSTKNDKLPDLNYYFESFAQTQYTAIQVISSTGKTKLLEDHALLLGVSSIHEIESLSFQDFRHKLYNTIAPQVQIASNMGFSSNWSYV